MTPSLFDLPLRLGDAVSFAALVYEFAEGRQISDDVRNRVGGRAALANFQAFLPFTGSLERDPIHPSAYYCCVDGVERQPLLLRIALASAPSSGLFPKAILIGRTHLGKWELVVNALPFGPGNRERVSTFSRDLNKSLLPSTFGSQPVIRLSSEAPAAQFGFAAEGFRILLKTSGQNLSCYSARAGSDLTAFYFATVWSMIRAGWRESYAIQCEPQNEAEAREAAPLYSRFAVCDAALLPTIREVRRKSFDIELKTSEANLETSLEAMKNAGFAAHSVRLQAPVENRAAVEAVAQRYRAQLNARDLKLGDGADRQSIVNAVCGI